MILVFDTETTGLIKAESTPLEKQPKIIEYAGIKLDNDLNEVERFQCLINPQQKLESIITDITGLTDNQLKDEKTFGGVYNDLYDFHQGVTTWVAHNVQFDFQMMFNDLRRIEKQWNFPYPKKYICTSDGTTFLNKGKRFKLGQLYEVATGKKIINAHRAMNDVEALVEVLRWLKSEHQFI